MKIYKITFNRVYYDQYDSFVLKQHPKDTYGEVDWESGFEIKEVPQDGEEEEILGSYNAG